MRHAHVRETLLYAKPTGNAAHEAVKRLERRLTRPLVPSRRPPHGFCRTAPKVQTEA